MGRNTEGFKFFVGREKKGKAAFSPLLLLRIPRMSFKTGTDRLHGRTGEACPNGEDRSESLCDFRRAEV